ncbi:MAG: EAL domain-containing response regulator [Chloroflexota bacterium]|nr:EAL domain-containing response regulator [Chloroflexota bacterium]
MVDDQDPNLELLRALLARAGYRNVDALSDPLRAVEQVRDSAPDLVLLDLHMPVLDGLALLQELSQEPVAGGHLPIIVLTADVDPSARRQALALGADDFLTKPFDLAEVLLRCRNLLETRFLHLDLEAQNRRLTGEVEEGGRELARQHEAAADITASLRALEPGADPEAAAGMFCDRLVALADFDAVGLIAFGTDSSAHAVAAAGADSVASLANQALPRQRAEHMIERARDGAWAEDIGPSRNPWEASLCDAGLRSGIWAPLEIDGELLGILTVATASEDAASFQRLLPRVVDFAAIARVAVGPALCAVRQRARSRDAITRLIEEGNFSPVFQPIVDMADGRILGHEALTRFGDGIPPDRRFAEAERVGLGLALEEACLRAAIIAADALPASTWLSLNVSPEMVLSPTVLAEVLESARRLVVLEVTEHRQIEDYGRFRDALARFGGKVRLAIDDAGAGFASFRHIIELRPDYVKLDLQLIRSVQDDPIRQALVAGLRYFSTKTGCTLIAEGIETEGERAALQALGVTFGQGYLLGRPAAIQPMEVPARTSADGPIAVSGGPFRSSRWAVDAG